MSNMEELKVAFEKAVKDDPDFWSCAISEKANAPSRKDIIDSMLNEGSIAIEFMLNQRVNDGENIQDVAQEFVDSLRPHFDI